MQMMAITVCATSAGSKSKSGAHAVQLCGFKEISWHLHVAALDVRICHVPSGNLQMSRTKGQLRRVHPFVQGA